MNFKNVFRNLALSASFLLLPFHVHGENSPWSVTFDPSFGLSLRYEGIPVIRQSTLYIVSPAWTPVLYNQELEPQQVERFNSEGGPGLTIRGGNDLFSSSYRMEALDEHRFRIVFQGELKQDVPARIEHAAGYFNGNLIAGVSFRGKSAAGKITGRVPDFPSTIVQHANEVLPHFKWLEFDSRIGILRVEADAGGKRVMFFDARRDPQGWARRSPVFWSGLGVPARPITYGQTVRLEMTISIHPHEIGLPSDVAEVSTETQRTSTAQSPHERPVQIIPTPKSAEIEGGGFHFSPATRWNILQPDEDPRLKTALMSLFTGYGMDLQGEEDYLHEGSVKIIIGEPENPQISRHSEWFSNPEGYRLTAQPGGIAIVASTTQGAYYGLKTLAQLMRPKEEEGAFCHGATIEDWPSMQFRGAHWFPSASGVPFHEKLIERIMARYKMNTAVIQCEAALWESHPGIAAPNSIHKPELQRLVDLSRKNYINPIPLINVPGHGEWMFRNGQNRHIVEDPGKPYAYCVNHPESFAFIQDILNEAIEIFQPDTFHLGHDEVTMVGQFPHPDCPRCHGENATSLVLQHMKTLNNWLREREIGMMIWGDMMLAKEEIPDTAAFAPNLEEAKFRRENMPDGIIITDWHYYEGDQYPSLGYFHNEGHPTIASTWHRPENIHHFAQAALEQKSLGLLQTTWAGYFPDEQVLANGLYQFTAFILAAEYAWSGRSEPPSALPFEAGTEFTREYYRVGSDQLPGRLVDISKAARTDRKDWLGLGDGWDFTGLPIGQNRLGDVLFEIPEKLVVVGGRLAPESAWQRAGFDLNVAARTIALLNAAAFGAPEGAVPARIIVTYSDGSLVQSNLVMGRTTAHWGQDLPALAAPVGWQKTSPANTSVTLRVSRWVNPHPEKIIARIDFEASDPDQAWALAGMTLID